jgi:imidazolonepropionase-like amidohydrolase
MTRPSTPLLISGATIIDGVADRPLMGCSIWIVDGRIKAISAQDDIGVPEGVTVVNARGKYVIPGLMNANVHLLGDIRLENLVRHMDHFEDIIIESAQIALRNGLTTVFDTWGPRRMLMGARDRINTGITPASRIFCAGNIIGFEGPFSQDFLEKAREVASASLVRRINSIWVENVGRYLMWLTPDQVGDEVRAYIQKGIDFVKYASNEHYWSSAGAFLQFSPAAQAAIVQEAHRAGLTAQAHCMSVEGLRIAIEAGCDLITHCNITGPVPIPESTLELFAKRQTGAVIFPWTEAGLDWIRRNVTDMEWTMWQTADLNARNLIGCGIPLLLANDGAVFSAETRDDPLYEKSWGGAPEDESLISLSSGHFTWFRAMEEKGCQPMEMLKAATQNIAAAYGKQKDLGTLEQGKIADLLILDQNPLLAARHYRSICTIIKDGSVIDRESLPTKPILTKPLEPPVEEERCYRSPVHLGPRLPSCPACMAR